jgi:hypothetical protein
MLKYWWLFLIGIVIAIAIFIFLKTREKNETVYLGGTSSGSSGTSSGSDTSNPPLNNLSLREWNSLTAQEKIKKYGSIDVRDYAKFLQYGY